MSDVYSLSMVTVEVCLFSESMKPPGSDRFPLQLVTGRIPFPEFSHHNVIIMILKGRRPQKPRHFDAPGMTLAVWKIAQQCWHDKADERPEVNAVLRSLEDLADAGMCAQKARSCLEYES